MFFADFSKEKGVHIPKFQSGANAYPTLEKIATKKAELLLVLERPDTSLHNNASENDIREFAKRRKVNGPTRSDAGRNAIDTFASLKKTYRKIGVSFWEYIVDRIAQKNTIPSLSSIISEKFAKDFRMARAG